MKRPLLALVLFAFATGCAGRQGGYPSLLPRDVERPDAPVAEVPPQPVAPDPALDAKIDAAMKRFDSAVAAFDRAAEQARPAVRAARGAATGSEAWIAGQNALADLGSLRAAILAPLADLEALAIDRAQAGEPPYPALETALEKAEAGDAAAAKQLQAIDAMAPPA